MIVAVLGCGKFVEGKVGWAIGHGHGAAYRSAFPEARLVAVDPNPENLAAFAERFGLGADDVFTSADAMYEALTPDLLSVCTWPGLHRDQVVQAAQRRVKGVLCEKPLALSPQEISEMRAACNEAGTVLAVAHQRRYSPEFLLAKSNIDRLGTPVHLEARVADGWDILSWTVHWFDMAAFLFDSAPLRVLAGVVDSGEVRYGHAVEDASVVFAEFADGHQATFVTGPGHPAGGMLTLRGPNGFMTVGDTVDLYTRDGFESLFPTHGEDSFAALLRDLWRSTETDEPFRCRVDVGAIGTLMAMAAYASATRCAWSAVPSLEQFNTLEARRKPAQPAFTGKIVLSADEHFGSRGREGIVSALGDQVRLHDATKPLTDADVEGAELLALYHTQSEPDEQTQRSLERWVNSGKPLLFLHCAVGAYPEWELFGRWAGRVWAWDRSQHPYEPCVLRANPAGAKILGFSGAWLPKDEVFALLEQRAEVEDLVSAEIGEGEHPAAWINREFPNVAAWIPGHREDIWQVPVMAQAVRALGAHLVDSRSVSRT